MTNQKNKTHLPYLTRWGWREPPEAVQQLALVADQHAYQSAARVAAALGLCALDEACAVLDRRPADRDELEFLITELPALKDHAAKLTALLIGAQYVDLNASYYEPARELMADKEIARECHANRALLVNQDGGATVLVFSDVEELREYRQSTGSRASASTLMNRFPDLPLALADREPVARFLQGLRQDIESEKSASLKTLKSAELRSTDETKLVDEIHALALQDETTDIHINAEQRSLITIGQRIYGDVEPMALQMSVDQYMTTIKYLLKASDASRTNGPLKNPCDGRYQYQNQRGDTVIVRASFIPSQHITIGGEPAVSASLRLIRMTEGPVDLARKGVRADVIKEITAAVRPGNGLIVLVGPTNSGKSTTIAGMITKHRELYGDKKNRLSAEDPVERILEGVHQFEVSIARRDTNDGFQILARNFMRHDPDAIFLGEVRDAQTAEYAIQFADSGHLVWTTQHANSPEIALQRMTNMLPTDKPMLKQSLIEASTLILGQRLEKRLCAKCRVERKIADDEVEQLKYIARIRGRDMKTPRIVFDANPAGCDACRKGIAGMIPLNQCLVLTSQLRTKLLAKDAPIASLAREGVTITFEQMALDYIEQGVVAFGAMNF